MSAVVLAEHEALDRVTLRRLYEDASRTHCYYGHEYNEQNTYRTVKTGAARLCRACRTEAARRSRTNRKVS